MPNEKHPKTLPGPAEPKPVLELSESDLEAAVGGTDSLHLLAQVNQLMAENAGGGIDKPPPPPTKPPVTPKTRPR